MSPCVCYVNLQVAVGRASGGFKTRFSGSRQRRADAVDVFQDQSATLGEVRRVGARPHLSRILEAGDRRRLEFGETSGGEGTHGG